MLQRAEQEHCPTKYLEKHAAQQVTQPHRIQQEKPSPYAGQYSLPQISDITIT
jgi:hypothetical protein